MVHIIPKSMSVEEIKAIYGTPKRKGKKGFPAKKFCGKIRKRGDAVAIQRKMRDEWK